MEQKRISNRKIREKLGLLIAKLPKQPTASPRPYSLPPKFAKQTISANYSQKSLQAISDHIGYYLGLLKSVEIAFIDKQQSDRWVGTPDGAVSAGTTKSPVSGLYHVDGFGHNRILLIKKCRYKFKHILAILAHEYTHNYLHHHNVKESEKIENEILTDLTTAYLGLGHLLIPGYKPITWTSNYWTLVFASGYTTHTMSIGYITPNTIRRAMIMSASVRGWDPKDVISSIASIKDKIIVYFQLVPYILKRRNAKKRSSRIGALKVTIDDAHKTYKQICELIKDVSASIDPSLISPEDGRMFVEIANEISNREFQTNIKQISEEINSLNALPASSTKFYSLVKQVKRLKNTLFQWHTALCKYNPQLAGKMKTAQHPR